VSLDLGGNWNHIVGEEEETISKTPPQTALGKLEEKGKVRGINSPLCHHRAKKQSHLKDTKQETLPTHLR